MIEPLLDVVAVRSGFGWSSPQSALGRCVVYKRHCVTGANLEDSEHVPSRKSVAHQRCFMSRLAHRQGALWLSSVTIQPESLCGTRAVH